MSSFNISHNNPQWDTLQKLLKDYQARGWILGESYLSALQLFITTPVVAHSEQAVAAKEKEAQLRGLLSDFLSQLKINESYLEQKLIPAPVGYLHFDQWVLPADPKLTGEANMLSYVLETVTESIRNANYQMESIARHGYALRLETDMAGVSHSPVMKHARLMLLDMKGRNIELGRIPVLAVIPMSALVNVNTPSIAFKGLLLDSPRAATTLKGPLGELALSFLRGPISGVFGKLHERKNITPTALIEQLKPLMYAPHAKLTADTPPMPHTGLSNQIVIPLNTSHRSVMAQINKVNRDFTLALSSSVQRGLSMPELDAGVAKIAAFCRQEKPEHSAAVAFTTEALIPPSDRSGANYLKKHLTEVFQRKTPDKERDFWQQLFSAEQAAPVSRSMLIYTLTQSGAGLYMNLPRKDFKFKQLPLKKATSDRSDNSTKLNNRPQQDRKSTFETRTSTPAKSTTERLPGSRDAHFKAISSLFQAMDGRVDTLDSKTRSIVDAVAPGLHPHFVMHRIESLQHLVRSVQTSQDPSFVKAGIYMMISCIEAQFRETGLVVQANKSDAPAVFSMEPMTGDDPKEHPATPSFKRR